MWSFAVRLCVRNHTQILIHIHTSTSNTKTGPAQGRFIRNTFTFTDETFASEVRAQTMLVARRGAAIRAQLRGMGPSVSFYRHGSTKAPKVGEGVPVGTPREDWDKFGYETRCASVVQVSDFAIRRVKPISLPIVLGSTFEMEDCAHGARLHAKKESPYADADGYVYGRWGSPTNEGAARQVAALEGIGPADDGGCMLFSSGMSAITGALTATLKKGDHAIFPYTVYGGTHEFLVEFLRHWGVEYTLVDSTDPQNYAKALKPNTRVVYTESPANPTCRLTDLDAVSEIVKSYSKSTGIKKPWVMCDSTFATPFHQRCLETDGVDVAIHSATKCKAPPSRRVTTTRPLN